jgi:hypothetical protein
MNVKHLLYIFVTLCIIILLLDKLKGCIQYKKSNFIDNDNNKLNFVNNQQLSHKRLIRKLNKPKQCKPQFNVHNLSTKKGASHNHNLYNLSLDKSVEKFTSVGSHVFLGKYESAARCLDEKCKLPDCKGIVWFDKRNRANDMDEKCYSLGVDPANYKSIVNIVKKTEESDTKIGVQTWYHKPTYNEGLKKIQDAKDVADKIESERIEKIRKLKGDAAAELEAATKKAEDAAKEKAKKIEDAAKEKAKKIEDDKKAALKEAVQKKVEKVTTCIAELRKNRLDMSEEENKIAEIRDKYNKDVAYIASMEHAPIGIINENTINFKALRFGLNDAHKLDLLKKQATSFKLDELPIKFPCLIDGYHVKLPWYRNMRSPNTKTCLAPLGQKCCKQIQIGDKKLCEQDFTGKKYSEMLKWSKDCE